MKCKDKIKKKERIFSPYEEWKENSEWRIKITKEENNARKKGVKEKEWKKKSEAKKKIRINND